MSSLVTTPSHTTWRTVTQQTTLHRHYKQHRTAPNHTATTNSTAPSIQTALHRHYKQHCTATTNSTTPSLQTAPHCHYKQHHTITDWCHRYLPHRHTQRDELSHNKQHCTVTTNSITPSLTDVDRYLPHRHTQRDELSHNKQHCTITITYSITILWHGAVCCATVHHVVCDCVVSNTDEVTVRCCLPSTIYVPSFIKMGQPFQN